MKNMKQILIIVLSCLLGSCKGFVTVMDDIEVINNSSHSIRFYLAIGNANAPVYPDTLLPTKMRPSVFHEVSPNTSGYSTSLVPWEEIVSQLPQDTLSVFIFHADTISKYTSEGIIDRYIELIGWEIIRDGYKILKRYDLSLEDLEETDFTITYP